MAAIKAGDRVTVVQRDVTAEDTKTQLYFAYFGGLTGTIDKVYDDDTVCVDIDLDALQEEARERHLAMQEKERRRWLDGLSDEARRRLTPEQQQLKMSYKILVLKKDIVPLKGGSPKDGGKSGGGASEDAPSSEKKGPDKAPNPTADEPAPKRVSEADLAAAEEAFLRSRQSKP